MNDGTQERINLLNGGRRIWWDVKEQRMVNSATAYAAFGCPDWGETEGKRNALCTFCGLPNAVIGYREAFHGGAIVPNEDHVSDFKLTLADIVSNGECHTLMVFNAGSFLAMPLVVQSAIVREVASINCIENLVIESRAPLVTEVTIAPLANLLSETGKRLTVRIGIESQDDHLRLKVLKKGHSRKQLFAAMEVFRKFGVSSGGYALLNPAPNLEREWAIGEATQTIDWILNQENGLGMNEVYFGPACVPAPVGDQAAPLTKLWMRGEFHPADLWSVLEVLSASLPRHRGKIHLLPFKDEPPFIAVPSNHVPSGIPETLDGAQGCDLEFHRMLDAYRLTMDPEVLYNVGCHCRQ